MWIGCCEDRAVVLPDDAAVELHVDEPGRGGPQACRDAFLADGVDVQAAGLAGLLPASARDVTVDEENGDLPEDVVDVVLDGCAVVRVAQKSCSGC